MKRKSLLCLTLVLCMMLSLAACGSAGSVGSAAGSADAGDPDGKIVIGVISPNTGALAAYGNGVVTGADLAVEEINASGGILGRQVELIKTDDQSDPTECLNAFNSLVAQGVGLIVGSATSGCTSAITDAAN